MSGLRGTEIVLGRLSPAYTILLFGVCCCWMATILPRRARGLEV